jgi:hypothetical protein
VASARVNFVFIDRHRLGLRLRGCVMAGHSGGDGHSVRVVYWYASRYSEETSNETNPLL